MKIVKNSNFYLQSSTFCSSHRNLHCLYQSIDRNESPDGFENYKRPKIDKQCCVTTQCAPNTVQYIVKLSVDRNIFHRVQKIGKEYDSNADRADNIIVGHSKELSNSLKLMSFWTYFI